MTEEFLKKIKKLDKCYYTLSDFLKIYSGKKNCLKVLLCRLTKKGKLLRIKRDIYIAPEKISEIKKIANQLYSPSYLSFESALSLWGILSQVPYILTFATPLKSKKYIFLKNTIIEYRQIKKDLFFGYFLKNNLYIAFPEKALLDTFYFASLGKLEINFKELDLSKIQKKKISDWIKKYPLKTKNLAQKFLE